MGKGNAGFTREKITGAGYTEISPGVWGQRAANSAPSPGPTQADKLERNPAEKPSGKTRAKKGGKKENTTGYYYQLVIVSYRARPIDASNGCPKYIEDAIVNQGLIPDDNIFFCPRPPIFHQILDIKPDKQRTEVFLFKIKQINEQADPSISIQSPDKKPVKGK